MWVLVGIDMGWEELTFCVGISMCQEGLVIWDSREGMLFGVSLTAHSA